jgi:hypothetical protein
VARFDFHGLTVETSSAFPADPGAMLLAALPPAPAGAAADLTIRLAPATPAELEQQLPGPDAFVYGASRLRIAGDTVELAWLGTRFTVTGPRVEGLVDPRAMEQPEGADLMAQGPLLMALSVALRSLGCYHLHAAALVLPQGPTVLVPALSGSGKSTLATTLILAGAGFLGDDTLFVRRDGASVRLLALPRDFHLTERSAGALGLTDRLDPALLTLAGKGRFDAHASFGDRFHAEAPAPDYILLPRITGEPATRLAPAGPSAALGALLESSALVATRGLPGGAAHLPVLASMANGATALHAELGLDLLSDPQGTATRLLAELGLGRAG